jgi:ABC-type antimicrobial peptide transport system permease subunit
LRSIATVFLAQFFGDVQIYCTHDENATFYALRRQILELVERTIVETIKAEYDRVYVFAHSLGSTIGLDALMRIYLPSLLSGLITDVFEKTQYLQCFPAKIFGVDLKSRPQDSCRSSERLSGP